MDRGEIGPHSKTGAVWKEDEWFISASSNG
jgi:hypothetical protein